MDGKQCDEHAVPGPSPRFRSQRDTTAHVFHTAYVKRGVEDDAQRPVTFLYNGGPGSATMWLHMGSFGPVRIATEDTSNVGGAPYQLTENPNSLLDVTDLVFVDAPGPDSAASPGTASQTSSSGSMRTPAPSPTSSPGF